MVQKQKITTDQMWKSLVFDYLSKEKRGKTNFYEHLRTKYKCEKSNALKKYDYYELEYDKLANNGKDAGVVDGAKEAVKIGIKSRTQFVLEIQKMLDDNETEETIWDFKNECEIRYMRKLTPLERKALYERISKFEGMDAPTKVAQTDVEGNDAKVKVIGVQFIE